MEEKIITKYDLIDAVYKDGEHEKKVVQAVVDKFIAAMKDSLKDGSSVKLRGFGTFEVRFRKGRDTARNPRTNERVKIEDHHVVVFRPGQEIKDTLKALKTTN